MIQEIPISTSRKFDAIDVTSKVEGAVRKAKVREGVCRLFIPHTTAGVIINEHADPSVVDDIMMELGKLVPLNDNYAHTEGNSIGHIKSSITGHSLELFVEEGSLRLGTWQGVFFCEFDGPRKRKIWVKVSAC
jgi:secondary thiamine-phosphate synthase enzyme